MKLGLAAPSSVTLGHFTKAHVPAAHAFNHQPSAHYNLQKDKPVFNFFFFLITMLSCIPALKLHARDETVLP